MRKYYNAGGPDLPVGEPRRKPKLKDVFEHTIDISTINADSIVIDLGCRSFGWSKAMLSYVKHVYCVDPDDSVQTEDKINLPLIRAAIVSKEMKEKNGSGIGNLVTFGNGTGNFILQDQCMNPPTHSVLKKVNLLTVEELILGFIPAPVELIKFDIEGSEIGILLSLQSPPARQLSVEFHMHTGTSFETVQKVVGHLSKWYNIAQHEISRRHGLQPNFWDSLFILKDDAIFDLQRNVGNYK